MKKILGFIEYVLCALIILDCRSVYRVSVDRYFIIELLLVFLFILLALNLLINNYDREKLKVFVRYMLIYYFYITFFMMLNNIVEIKGYIRSFCIILPMLCCLYYTSKNSQQTIHSNLTKIKNLMYGLAVISLILYFLGPICNIIKPTGYMYYNWGGIKKINSYFGLQFVTQKISVFGFTIIRNTGIFAEGPMYSLNLTIALAIELFIEEKKSIKKIITFVITIITTISTTGIIIASFMFMALFLNKKDKKYISQVLKILIVPIICIVLVMANLKLFNERSDTKSFSTRKDDYKACLAVWKKHPIIGAGYGNVEPIQEHMSSFRKDNKGLSNSILVLLAECGLYLFLIYIIPFFKTIIYGINLKKINIIVFNVVIMLLFIITIFTFNVMIFNFMAMGYALNSKNSRS